VWGNGWQGHPCLSGGLSGGGAFIAHMLKLLVLSLPLLPLIGRWTVCAVKGLDWCGETDGIWWSLLFSGTGVGAWEMSRMSTWVSDWGTAHKDDKLKGCQPAGAHDMSAICVPIGHKGLGIVRVTLTHANA
jgi:hypothetical protein